MSKGFLRLISALLATVLALSALSIPALAAEAEPEDGAQSIALIDEENAKAPDEQNPQNELSHDQTNGPADDTKTAVEPTQESGSVAQKDTDLAAIGNDTGNTASAQISGIHAMSNGVRVSWSKSSGTGRVAVLRDRNGSWEQIAATSDSFYLDKSATTGNSYRYTVRALNNSGAYAQDDYDTTGTSFTYCATPVLHAKTAVGGVQLNWDAIPGAEGYRIFYLNRNGVWTSMKDVTTNSLLDTVVSSGGTYTYTVRCLSADGKQYTSYYDETGATVKYIAAPEIVAADSTTEGVRITWKPSNGAAQYRVFYKNSEGGWSRLGTTSGTSFTDNDVRSGKNYYYTVRCMDSAGNYISDFDQKGITASYIAAPVVKLSNAADGVDIRWDAVPGAGNYRIFYYGSKGWSKLTDTNKTSFLDTKVSSGRSYTYTVRCIDAAGDNYLSDYHDGKDITFYAAPKISGLSNEPDGVRINWNAVSGAAKYRVYSYDSNGWSRLADTASTTYADNSAPSGATRTYTVRCLDSSGNPVSDFRTGVSIRFVAAPVFTLTRNEKSITISWNAVPGAEMYRVYYRAGNVWKICADTKKTSFEDTVISSGHTYTYTVRCIAADASRATSDYRNGKSIRYVSMPRVSLLENGEKGVDIRWAAVTGAAKYCVYVKNGNGWTRIGVTTGTRFTHTGAKSGTTCTYTVRCISSDEKEFESVYDTTGKSIYYIAAPANIKAENDSKGVKISWTASAGAAKYRVFYYGSKGWTKLEETTGTSVIDTDVNSGKTYRYTVRCLSADSKSFTSGFNSTGATCKYIAAPKLKEADYTKNGVIVSWYASAGAAKYRVYYYGSNGWTRMADTTSTYVVDTDVNSGKTYRYTVRCITSDGNSFTSDFDHNGLNVYYVSAPKLQSTNITSSGLTLKWSKPNGASKYRLYKRINGSWSRLTDTTSNSYTDKNVSRGSTYSYTVRVINNAGDAFYSGYDATGFIITVVTDASGNFYYYDQTQYDYPYGDDTIANCGCGPTSFAMIASTLKGRSITPIDAVAWCGNNYYLEGAGTYWSYFDAATDYFDLPNPDQYGAYEIDSVISELKKGKYAISSQGPGTFTRGGHFIVLAGVTSNGRIIVYDPNGGNHYVGTTFTPDQITEAGTHYWVFDK